MTVDALTADSAAEDLEAARPSLQDRRDDLRDRLRRNHPTTVLGGFVEAVGEAVRRLLRRPEPLPYWWSGAIVTGILASIFVAETLVRVSAWSRQREMIPLQLAFLALFLMLLWVHRTAVVAVSSALREHLVEHVESPADLERLDKLVRMVGGYGLLPFLVLSVLVGGLFEGLNLHFAYSRIYESASLSLGRGLGHTAFFMATLDLFAGWILYVHLARFRLRLYAPDPSKSEVIARLWAVIGTTSFLVAVYVVCFTLAFDFLGFTHWTILAGLILCGWIPIIGSFVIGVRSLSKLITRAKWRELREVQERVERLKATGQLEEEETMGAIQRLMDYHDRVARTPGSVLDFRAGLRFVNSLLLPVVALLLANFETFWKLFSGLLS